MTASLARRLAPLLLLLESACGIAAPEISTAAACALGVVPVRIERGVALGSAPEATCDSFAHTLGEYRDTFVQGWGSVALQEEGWTLRVRAGDTVDDEGHTGITYHLSRVVDISQSALETFPHELRHVQLGRSSDDHHGWCSTFAPWEERVLGVDERSYLGCRR